jgi:hypothetical protein
MDDQNVYVNAVEDEAVQNLLDTSDLILGISLPLCQTYEKKYGQKIWFIPPVVESYSHFR